MVDPFLFEFLFDPYRVGMAVIDTKPWALPMATQFHTFGGNLSLKYYCDVF
jgi:hypothetical protein